MCYYKRVVFKCNHSSFGKISRKCFLQLAYENGERGSPCGKRDINPIQSIKVQVLCRECSTKVTDQAHKIAAIKQKIAKAKVKLKIDVDDDDKEDSDNESVSENETLSPVSLSFSSRWGAELGFSSTGSGTRKGKSKEKGCQ